MVKKRNEINRNEKHKYYTHLLNSKRWWGEVMVEQLRKHPLCQLCEKEGLVVSAVDVHHLRPVQSFPKEAMEAACYDPDNLISLCVPCHIRVHKEMRSHVGQLRDLPNLPHEQQQPDTLTDFSKRMTGTASLPRPKPKKGIRRTPLGWMTKEEFRQKQEEKKNKWVDDIANRFKAPGAE